MPESTSSYTDKNTDPCRKLVYAALLFLLAWLSSVGPLHAAEPVEIVVTGIEGDVLKNVKESLVLPAGLVHDGSVDRSWLERFAKQSHEKTRIALEPFGYYNSAATISVEQNGERFRLLVKVVPGEAVILTEVTVTIVGAGREESGLRSLVAAFPLHKGDVLLQHSYEEAKGALKSRAQDLGYLDAQFSRHEILISRSATTATIDLVLDTGEKYYFGATSIQGAPAYPDSFLRRNLTYKSGDLFSYPRLGETQRNFTDSERFKDVTVTPDKEKAEAFMVPVNVHLKAAPSISLRPGIGYGTDTGARFTARYRDLNMFHLGHELYSHLYLAERLQGLVTGYILPSPKDVRSSTSVQLNLQKEENINYLSKIAALELDRNRSFAKGQLGTIYVKAQYEEYSVGDQNSNSRLLLPGLRFSDNRYDNPVRPSRGFRYSLDLHGTHQLLGSDTALVQILAEGSYIMPLPWRLSLYGRAKGGVTLLSDPLRDIPPSLRFFTGGDQSVRGFSYNSLGPRDSTGKVVGGKQLVASSVELERAIFTNWGVSIFYDVGNTFNSFADYSLFRAAGVGLHYFTPIGALNLAVARPIAVENPSIHIHFTVGFEL